MFAISGMGTIRNGRGAIGNSTNAIAGTDRRLRVASGEAGLGSTLLRVLALLHNKLVQFRRACKDAQVVGWRDPCDVRRRSESKNGGLGARASAHVITRADEIECATTSSESMSTV
jgi:hypothetical protein